MENQKYPKYNHAVQTDYEYAEQLLDGDTVESRRHAEELYYEYRSGVEDMVEPLEALCAQSEVIIRYDSVTQSFEVVAPSQNATKKGYDLEQCIKQLSQFEEDAI